MGASDSKFLFRHRVNQLIARPVRLDDHEFWRLLYIAQLTTEEVFSLVQPCDVRRLRQKQPTNLAFLIFKSIEQLFIFGSNELTDFTSASNSIRILSRVIPFVFENGRFDSQALGNDEPNGQQLCLDDEVEVEAPQPSRPLPEGYDVVENLFWRNRILGPEGKDLVFTTIADKPLDRPLGMLLMQLLLHVCFYPRFTRPLPKVDMGNPFVHGYPHLMPLRAWCGGLGVPEAHLPPSTAVHDVHRVDVLRCILACCTQTVFEKDPLTPNKFAGCLTGLVAPPTVTLCYSLLNVIGSYNPKGSLPYSSYLGVSRETLLEASLHVLLTLLDYGPLVQAPTPTPTPPTPPSPDTTNEAPDPQDSHAFWFVLRHLSKEEDLRFLFTALTRLLGNHLDAANTLLPLSQRQISCHAELLLLLWKLIEANPAFRLAMCKRFDVCRLVRALLWYVFETENDQSQFSTLQVVTLILLALSAERDFAVSLNTPLTEKVPMQLPHFTGTHADLVVLVAHQYLTLPHAWTKPLQEYWLTVLCNLSPYIKSLCPAAAAKLLHLFEAFTGPKLLRPEDPRSVGPAVYLVDIFNNLIQYQYEGSASLVHMMVRQPEAFLRLARLVQEEKAGAGDGPPRLPAEARDSLHLGTITRMLKAVSGELESLNLDARSSTEAELRAFIQRTTLVGLLPIPHPILIRRFEMQPDTRRWLTSWQWGVICLRATDPPLLDNGVVRLSRMQNAGKGTGPGKPETPAPTPTPPTAAATPSTSASQPHGNSQQQIT